MIDS
ncbi:hypothetical protein N7453_011906 [Penicillium expansum]|jgi:hypothetical protein